jgi:hypothetical protein
MVFDTSDAALRVRQNARRLTKKRKPALRGSLF